MADPSRLPGRFRITTDTADFFIIGYDDVVVLDTYPVSEPKQ